MRASTFLVVVAAADALGRRQFVVSTPGEQPGLHVLGFHVVPGLHLTVRQAGFRQQSLLVGDVGLDRIGDQKVGTAAGFPGQTGQPSLGFRLEPDAEGRAFAFVSTHNSPRLWCVARLAGIAGV